MTTPELFLKFHYPEVRELTVTFLTICSSVFALSAVFAENLATGQDSGRRGRVILYSSWSAFILALGVGGHGLFRLLLAADFAHGGRLIGTDMLFGNTNDFGGYVTGVFSQLFIAGMLFVGGLVLLGVSAFYKLFRPEDTVPTATDEG